LQARYTRGSKANSPVLYRAIVPRQNRRSLGPSPDRTLDQDFLTDVVKEALSRPRAISRPVTTKRGVAARDLLDRSHPSPDVGVSITFRRTTTIGGVIRSCYIDHVKSCRLRIICQKSMSRCKPTDIDQLRICSAIFRPLRRLSISALLPANCVGEVSYVSPYPPVTTVQRFHSVHVDTARGRRPTRVGRLQRVWAGPAEVFMQQASGP